VFESVNFEFDIDSNLNYINPSIKSIEGDKNEGKIKEIR